MLKKAFLATLFTCASVAALAQSPQSFTVTVPAVPSQTFTDSSGNSWQLTIPNNANIGTLVFNPNVAPNYSVTTTAQTGCGGPATTCAANNSVSVSAGQFVLVTVEYCDGPLHACAAGTPAGATVSSVNQTSGSATTSCTRATGIAGQHEAGANETHDTFICSVSAPGTAIYTATLSANGSSIFLDTDVVSGLANNPDDGWGKHSANLTVTNPSVTSTGTNSIANEFMYSVVVNSGANPATPGTGWTVATSTAPAVTQWKVSGPANQTQTATATVGASSNTEMSIMGLK